MRRGEIYWVDLDPTRGSESNKSRPVVVVSNNGATTTASKLQQGLITVVPITTNITRIYPFQVFLDAKTTGLPSDSKAQAEQVRSIDVRRISNYIGSLSTSTIAALDEALRVHLAL